MKIRLVIVIALVISVLGVVGLQHPTVTAQGPTTVEIYFPIAVDSPVTQILDGYATTYMADHPDVTIKFSYEGGYSDVNNKLITTKQGGGQLPALAIMLATDIYDLRNAEVIAPWDQYVTQDYLDDFFPTWLANSYYDYDQNGTPELYGLPFQRSTVVLYYNKTLLDANNLSMPTNWDELATTAQALTTADRWGILIPNSWPYWEFQPFVIGAGQNIVTESDNEVFFNTPAAISALQYWLDLFQVYKATPEGVQNNWGDAPGLFADGSAAIILHSTGSLPGILSKANFEVAVTAVPGKDGGMATVTGGGNLYLVAGTDDATAQAAWEFTQWLTSPEMAVDWSIKTGYICTRKSGLELDAWTQYVAQNPQAAEAAATIDVAGREFSVQQLNDVRNSLHSYILKVLNLEMTPTDAMAAAQNDADQILSKYR
jgi:sn-glycerol 3-phosphate transport system substrate-binding protein